ncbi:diguanylate cyclase domain-containing protein [Sneathiella limimaris]|uniref:diguanylate cyclase domain-containing protein n=1 Tax=Sneathiella limimaris TaxID=1964213 RepID=UPI00146B78E7|nr:diguanylate cyclase [Sneathiella limimaris]
MSVTANILVISDEPADRIRNCFKNENVALTKTGLFDVSAIKEDLSDFDLTIISSSSTDLKTVDELLDYMLENDFPLLIVGNNHRSSEIQSVPFSFCDLELKTRAFSLIRLQTMKQEFKRRRDTTSQYGFTEDDFNEPSPEEAKKSILLVGNHSTVVGDIMLHLNRQAKVRLCPTPDIVVEELRSGVFDAAVFLGAGQGDVHFRLCMDIRGDSRLYNLPIVFVLENKNNREASYIHGASDIVMYPEELASLFARTNLLIDQSNYRFSMQKLFKSSRPLPVTDGLTGLYSHGFVQAHMKQMIEDHQKLGKHLSVAAVTLSNLNTINAEHGYPAGDQILRQMGNILGFLIRGEDFAGRYSSNCFLIALPGTSRKDAFIALSRVYGVTRNTQFAVAAIADPVLADINLGLTELQDNDNLNELFERAITSPFNMEC